MLTQSVILFLGQIVTVITPDMVEIFGILLKKADKDSIFTDRLSEHFGVILTQVKTVDIIVATANVVIILTLVLLSQLQIVEYHQIFVGGIELPRIWRIVSLLEEEGCDTTWSKRWWEIFNHIDQRVRTIFFDGEKFSDIFFSESHPQCLLHELVDRLVK